MNNPEGTQRCHHCGFLLGQTPSYDELVAEVARLRKLVIDAYDEGIEKGCGDYPSFSWDDSDAKKRLEGKE